MRDNTGRYGMDFSKPPKQEPGESPQAYGQRLKDWQRKRSMSGDRQGTGKPRPANAPPPKKKESATGWAAKIVEALK